MNSEMANYDRYHLKTAQRKNVKNAISSEGKLSLLSLVRVLCGPISMSRITHRLIQWVQSFYI